MSRYEVAYARFTSAEVERICGQPATGRFWIDASGVEISVHQLAGMLLNAWLSRYVTIDLAEGAAVAGAGAPAVLWFALVDVAGACGVESGPRGFSTSEWLEMHAADLAGLRSNSVSRYLIKAGDAPAEFVADLGRAADCSGCQGGIFIDLRAAGLQLARSAGRPLVRVKLAPA